MKNQVITAVTSAEKIAAINKYSAKRQGYSAYQGYSGGGKDGGKGRQQEPDGYVPTPYRRSDEAAPPEPKRKELPEFYSILKKSLEDKNKMSFAQRIRSLETTGQSEALKHSIDWALEFADNILATPE